MFRTAIAIAICLVAGVGLAQAQGGKKSSSNDEATEAIEVSACSTFSGGSQVCSCEANAQIGSVWGSGPYTADSNICTAARHAGVIGSAGGTVSLVERPGQASYSGTSANGITTSDWGSYGQSFDVAIRDGAVPVQGLAACGQMPSGVDLYACRCQSNPPAGSVWGNGPYTADSDICTAAIHNGYIDETGGDVFVLSAQGLDAYLGDESFGVTSSDWGAYDRSISFDWNR